MKNKVLFLLDKNNSWSHKFIESHIIPVIQHSGIQIVTVTDSSVVALTVIAN